MLWQRLESSAKRWAWFFTQLESLLMKMRNRMVLKTLFGGRLQPQQGEKMRGSFWELCTDYEGGGSPWAVGGGLYCHRQSLESKVGWPDFVKCSRRVQRQPWSPVRVLNGMCSTLGNRQWFRRGNDIKALFLMLPTFSDTLSFWVKVSWMHYRSIVLCKK